MNNKIVALIAIVITVSINGCKKEEYMPPEVGEQVPYTDTVTIVFRDALSSSPYTVFWQAWQRSKVDSILAARGGTRAHYTLLVPTNEALAAAGWDAAKVNASSASSLNTLLLPYVFRSRIAQEQLQTKQESYRAVSLYDYPDLRYTEKDSTYFFQVGLAWDEQALKVNGKSVGLETPIPATDGYIWPINTTLEPPSKTAWQTLKEDGRFGLYTALLEYTDAQYKQLFTDANGYPPEAGHPGEQVYNRNSPLLYDLENHVTSRSALPYAGALNTWFIPTDEAFAAAGFHTLADLIAFNTQRGLPRTAWYFPEDPSQAPFYRVVGEFATDTLLDYHDNWGMRVAGYDLTRSRNATLFFSNDLQQETLGHYPVSAYTEIEYGYWYPLVGTTTYHYMPLEFPTAGSLRVKGATASSATIIEPDIYTLNGVIHVVDHLLIPSKFGHLSD